MVTGKPDFGTNEVFEGQTWGSFPRTPPAPGTAFQPTGWANINPDGTIASQGPGNLFTVIKGSTGNWIVMPANALVGVPSAKWLVGLSCNDNVPAIMSFAPNAGPGSAGVDVTANVIVSGANTPTDIPFQFLLWLPFAP